jgi:hypothetical protein
MASATARTTTAHTASSQSRQPPKPPELSRQAGAGSSCRSSSPPVLKAAQRVLVESGSLRRRPKGDGFLLGMRVTTEVEDSFVHSLSRSWGVRRPWAIAVGTALSGGPPRRSQRARLTHWAPALGVGGEPRVGPGMHNTGGR